jgi:hypothetical protein
VEGDVPVDSETFLVADFVNLKIKLAQSFEYAHRDRMYVYVFIECSYVYKYVCLYCVSKKKSRIEYTICTKSPYTQYNAANSLVMSR